MLDMAGKPPAPLKPEIDLKSINQPSQLNSVLAAVLLVSMLVITLTVFFLGRAQTKKLAALDQEKANITSELQTGSLAKTATKAEQVAQALGTLQRGTKDGLVWSGLFQTLQGVSTNGITLQSLSIDTKNLMKLEGKSQSYVLLAQYLATLRTAPVLKRTDLLSAALVETLEGQQVNFVLQVEIDPTKVALSQITSEGSSQ